MRSGPRSLGFMSNAEILAGELAKLSDAELAAVVGTATDGRAALAALHEVAVTVAATVGHAPTMIDVTPDTSPATTLPQPGSAGTFGQVGASPVPPGHSTPRTDIPTGSDIGGYSGSGVPTFESVRDKVERRYGTAQGMDELDRQTPAGRSVDEQWDARERAARERLEQIRKSVHGNDSD